MTRKDGRPRSVSAATTDPRAYGVVLSSASATAGDLIATYAPTYGAAVDAAVAIQRAQPGIVATIVRKRGANHPIHPGKFTDATGRTPEQIAAYWRDHTAGEDA